MRLTVVGLILALLALVACGEDASESAVQGSFPVYAGAADGFGDQPDFDCRVVLRSLKRLPWQGGYATVCELSGDYSQSCHYVWEGHVDVWGEVLDDITAVEVLYAVGSSSNTWYKLTATAEQGPEDGFAHYKFLIDDHTPTAGNSMSSLNNTYIKVIPYLVTPSARYFDHNRVADPLGSYAVNLGNGFAIAEAPEVCAPLEVVDEAEAGEPLPEIEENLPVFELSWPDTGASLVDGPVFQGGQVQVVYDSDRLIKTQGCMGSYGPASSSTIMMGWKFDNRPEEAFEAKIEAYLEQYGYLCHGESPCITRTPFPSVIDVPLDATGVQVWFYCVPGYGSASPANWKYDSNMGQNYPISVSQARSIDWAGDWSLYLYRSGESRNLPQTYEYHFDNMGYGVTAQVYVKGLTDQPGNRSGLLAFVETDLLSCGETLETLELTPHLFNVGPYGSNTSYLWGLDEPMSHCPAGTYRYRLLFSADGAQTLTPLGAGEDSLADNAGEWRLLVK